MNDAPSVPTSKFKQSWKDSKSWSWAHYLIWLGMDPLPGDRQYPKFDADAAIPRLRQRDLHRFLLPKVTFTFLLHLGYTSYSKSNPHFIFVFVYYAISFKLISLSTISFWRNLGANYGYLDGAKGRDEIPADSVKKVTLSLLSVSSFRTVAATFIAYDRNLLPSISPLLPLQMAAYTIVLDFWFYWYHRAMHEVSWLWKYHRTHHLTKHPNASLALFADAEQEVFDILIIPILTYYSLRPTFLSLSFYDWWFCMMYVVFIELGGHSGVRLVGSPPAAGFGLLNYLGLELIIEDHDLHHRRGWKQSGNYGKQTRVFDKLFGTLMDREECVPSRLDGSVARPFR